MHLGLWTSITPDTDLAAVADRIADLGFSSLHAHFAQGCDERLARRLVRATSAAGLSIAAISGYANPLRPGEAAMGATLADLEGLIDLMPLLDTRILVTWSGSYAEDVLAPHADNQSPQAWDLLRRSVDDLLPLLDQSEAMLAIEPYHTHVLGTVARIKTFFGEFASPYLGVVLDPPNLLPADTWINQAEQITAMVDALAPFVRAVHFKDMRMHNGLLELTGPGLGVLEYPAFLAALAHSTLQAPLIIEHVTLAQAAEARRFVLAQARAVA